MLILLIFSLKRGKYEKYTYNIYVHLYIKLYTKIRQFNVLHLYNIIINSKHVAKQTKNNIQMYKCLYKFSLENVGIFAKILLLNRRSH